MLVYALVFVCGFITAAALSYFQLLRGFEKYRNEAKEKLRHYSYQLKVASLKVEQFRSLNHELLTPIHGIRGLTESLSTTPLNPDQKETLHQISSTAFRIFNVMRGICHFHINEIVTEEIEIAPGSEVHVLVVEDEMINQKIVRTYLEKSGMKVTLASSGREALQILQQQDFDLVIMDISMPEMSGVETTQRLRQMPGIRKDLPIIAFTANSSAENREECFMAGMNDYVSKPANAKELLSILVRYLPKKVLLNKNPKPKVEYDVSLDALLDEIGASIERQEFAQLACLCVKLTTSYQRCDFSEADEIIQDLETMAKNQDMTGAITQFSRLKELHAFAKSLSPDFLTPKPSTPQAPQAA